MRAMHLTGHGGPEKLVLRTDLPLPEPGPGEVQIRVGACGMNNTDINTRTGWYSKAVTSATDGAGYDQPVEEQDSTWGGAGISFPRIQGADVAGRITAVGEGVDASRIGERVLVDPWLRAAADPGDRTRAGYLGSERDGGFAEYCTVPAVNAFAITSGYSDAELATFPCSYSTAEYMLTRAELGDGERVLVTGASGGVGSALVQLAKRRGARVTAIAGRAKLDAVADLGADAVVARGEPLPDGPFEVVADVVGGDEFPALIDRLVRGGRYVTSGAIAGPLVPLDLRTLYLSDLTLLGATVMPRGIFGNLVSYIERREIRPLLAKRFPLAELAEAQEEFSKKQHVGNFVVLPGADAGE